MVSNVLEMESEEVAEKLRQMSQEHASDPEYQEWRAGFPPDWPM